MAKSKQRREAIARKNARKREAIARPKGKSNYARKVAFLRTYGGWGSDYPDKPWKSV